MSSPAELRERFQIDPEVRFLNHGSFGACPRPVAEAQAAWLREMERQPVLFFARRYASLMATVRERLASYLGTAPLNLVWVANATIGVNIVARSLAMQLGPGDEVLGCDHEYGACDRTWRYLGSKHGFAYRRAAVPPPLTSPEAVVEQIWSQVGPNTKLLFLSHITSPTGLRLPIEALCARARAAGIPSLIDGAHAPGQIDLDLDSLGADFYTGNCHKWLCAPKGAAFLYARPEMQARLEPLVVSWGFEPEPGFAGPSPFVDEIEFWGTRDVSPFLSIPAAIDFQAEHDWPTVRERCHALLSETRARLLEIPGIQALHPDDPAWYAQMLAFELPAGTDPMALQARLYEGWRVEIPGIWWNGRPLMRVSIQGYNTAGDVDALIEGLWGALG